MPTRYVNTASTAGGDGTTNNTAGATRAFATLLEAVNSLPSSLSGAYTIYCEGSTADTSAINQTPWDMTTTVANYILIIGEQSPNHPNFSRAKSGKYDTSLYRIEVTNTNAIYNNYPAHLRLEGIQVQVTVTNGSQYICIKMSNANQGGNDVDCRAEYCIVKGVRTNGDVVGLHSRPTGTGNGSAKFWNCVAYDCQQGAESDWANTTYYNCTIKDCDYGMVADAAMTAINCLVDNCAGGCFVGSFSGSSNYNAASDSSAPGANSRQSQTFTFVNAGSDDFHLASNDAGARDYGNGSDVKTYFTDDVDGQTRPATDLDWDIGADEYVLVPSGTLSQSAYRIRHDDGSEASAAWAAPENAVGAKGIGETARLRLQLDATGDPAAITPQLQYRRKGDATWLTVESN